MNKIIANKDFLIAILISVPVINSAGRFLYVLSYAIYFICDALSWVIFSFYLYAKTKKPVFIRVEKVLIEDILFMVVSNLLDEFFFDPEKFGLNEFIFIIFIIVWTYIKLNPTKMDHLKHELLILFDKLLAGFGLISLGVAGMIGSILVQKRKLTRLQWCGIILLAVFFGKMAYILCGSYGFSDGTKSWTVPLATLLAEKIIIALFHIDYKRIILDLLDVVKRRFSDGE